MALRRILLCAVIALGLLLVPAAHAAPPDPRFGAVEAFFAPNEADGAGVAWERVLFYWREIQPQPDLWRDDYFPPEILQRELASGREIVGLLINPPWWANEGRGDRGVPAGLYLPYDDPGNDWGQFVSRIVAQYRGVIRHWILWNEPDVWDKSHFGYTWDGTVEDFAQLTKVGYLAAKHANPECVVHLAGLTYWWDTEHGRQFYLERLLQTIDKDPDASANGFYFDVVSLHIYFKPRTIPEIIAKTRSALRRYGLDKPIWVDETNAPPRDDPAHPIEHPRFPVTLSQQRAFLFQAFALSLSAGAERVAAYKMSDRPSIEPWEEPFGLIRLDGSKRPVYDALEMIAGLYSGTHSATWNDAGDYAVVTLDQGQKTTTVLWNWTTGEVKARLAAITPDAQLVAADGSVSEIAAEGGVYRLALPPAECGSGGMCDIGGQPVILVEQGRASARGRLLPPTPTATPTITTTPRPTTISTPTPIPSATPTAFATLVPSPTASKQPPTMMPTSVHVEEANPSSQDLLPALLMSGGVVLFVLLWLGIARRRWRQRR